MSSSQAGVTTQLSSLRCQSRTGLEHAHFLPSHLLLLLLPAILNSQNVENAQIMGETPLEEGLWLVSGGTDNHLLLVDLRSIDVTGESAEEIWRRRASP